MAIIVKPYTFSAGATIIASEHNSNNDTIYNDYNGNINDSNLAGNISDSKLGQLSTAGKVSGTALTNLPGIPAGAGTMNVFNIGLIDLASTVTSGTMGILPVARGGSGLTAGLNSANGIVSLNGSAQLPAVDGSLLTGLVGGYFSGQIIRDLTATSGSVAYTGMGFKPKGAVFFGQVKDGANLVNSLGTDDGTHHTVISLSGDGTIVAQTAYSIYFVNGANSQYGYITSFDSDGFTISWTKGSSGISATAYIVYMAYR